MAADKKHAQKFLVEMHSSEEDENYKEGIADLNNEDRTLSSVGHLQRFSPANATKELQLIEETAEPAKKKARRSRGGRKTVPYIIGNEICSGVAVIGLSANMIVYLTRQFNIKNIAATHIINISTGSTNLSPLIGAFVADSYLGRFWTIGITSFVLLIGTVLIMLTAIIHPLRPPACNPAQQAIESCQGPSKGQLAVLYTYFVLATIASGGLRYNSIAFGADQFQNGSAKETRETQSFFNWYYSLLNASIIVATTVVVYIQDSVSWSWGFGVCTVLTALSILFYFSGTQLYNRSKPEGSPFTGFAQVIVASLKKRHLPLPSNAEDFYNVPSKEAIHLTEELRFLNKAAVRSEGDFKADGTLLTNPWRLCTVQQIEELKSVIKTLPIWSCGIILSIMVAEQSTFTVLQALTMDRHLGSHFTVPAASFNVFSLLASAAWLPIYDKLFVPFARRITNREGGITQLQRIVVGHIINAAALGVAALVEMKRLNVAQIHGIVDKPGATIPMSAFWLVPQYALAGLAEAFHTVGQLDFFYDQFPLAVRSMGFGLLSANIAAGYYLSSVLVGIIHNSTSNWLPDNINRGHLDYFYCLLSVMGMRKSVEVVVASPRSCDLLRPRRRPRSHMVAGKGA
eukprot:Gb_05206 [translate_table: standard]